MVQTNYIELDVFSGLKALYSLGQQSGTAIIATNKYYSNLLCDQEHLYGSTIQQASVLD